MPDRPNIFSIIFVDKLILLKIICNYRICKILGISLQKLYYSQLTNVPNVLSIFSIGGHWNCKSIFFAFRQFCCSRSSHLLRASFIVVALDIFLTQIICWFYTFNRLHLTNYVVMVTSPYLQVLFSYFYRNNKALTDMFSHIHIIPNSKF